MKAGARYCAWCGRIAMPAIGKCLDRVHPGRTFCTGCGRVQLHCECSRLTVQMEKAA